MRILKITLSIIFIISLLANSAGQSYALRPMATAVLEIPKLRKGYVHLKNLQTGESETITRGAFLRRRKTGKLKDVLVTEKLDATGELRLGNTSYGEPYIVCIRPENANQIVRYHMENGILTNIVFFSKGLPLEKRKLAVVKGLFAEPVDSFLFENGLPDRVESLAHEGRVSSIENLLVDEDNIIRFSNLMCYDFKPKGNFADNELTVYFWGKPRPLQFSIKNNKGRYTDIAAHDILIPLKTKKDQLSIFERQEIREALFEAMYEIPLRMRTLAMEVLKDWPLFADKAGISKFRLAEHFGVRIDEINELVKWFGKSESLRRMVDYYGLKKVSDVQKRSIVKHRLSIKPLPIPEAGSVLIRNMTTDRIETIKRVELIQRYRGKRLSNEEVVYDRLDSDGRYVLGTDVKNGKRMPNLLFTYSRFPNQMIRYIVRNGKIDRASVIFLDENGYPLEKDGLGYAVNANTGELMCHLPVVIHKDLRTALDNVVISDRLTQAGGLNFGRTESGESITVAAFTTKKHRRRKLRYNVVNGKVDRTTIVLVNEDGTVYRGTDTRYAVISETGDIRCHLPDKIFEELRRQLDGMTIFDRTDNRGCIRFGKFKSEEAKPSQFINYPNHRIRYKVRNGKIDKTTIVLLNEDGTILEDSSLRYAVEPVTNELRCHLPGMVHKGLAKQLDGLIVYDRLQEDGRGSFAEGRTECRYKRFRGKKQRMKFTVLNGKMDRTTILLLNEDGTLLEDDTIRRVVSPETGKIRCHLPDYLSRTLRLKLDDMLIYDELDNYGHIWLEPSKDQCVFEGHPNRKVIYKYKGGKIDRATLILLDDKGSPLDDGETMYAIDIETGQTKFHLPKQRLNKQWFKVLDNVEVVNAGLDDSNGALWLKGLPRYYYYRLAGNKIRYKIYDNKLVSITIIAKNGNIILEEILDEVMESETFPTETDIEYILLPGGNRIITYDEFSQKLCSDYDRFIKRGMTIRDIAPIIQKRLYELLHKSVYFYFGEELSIDMQLKLKSQIFFVWSGISSSSEEEARKKLLSLRDLFKKCAEEVSYTLPKHPRKIPDKLIKEIDFNREIMVKGGIEHGRELDLDKRRKYKVKLSPATQRAINAAA